MAYTLPPHFDNRLPGEKTKKRSRYQQWKMDNGLPGGPELVSRGRFRKGIESVGRGGGGARSENRKKYDAWKIKDDARREEMRQPVPFSARFGRGRRSGILSTGDPGPFPNPNYTMEGRRNRGHSGRFDSLSTPHSVPGSRSSGGRSRGRRGGERSSPQDPRRRTPESYGRVKEDWRGNQGRQRSSMPPPPPRSMLTVPTIEDRIRSTRARGGGSGGYQRALMSQLRTTPGFSSSNPNPTGGGTYFPGEGWSGDTDPPAMPAGMPRGGGGRRRGRRGRRGGSPRLMDAGGGFQKPGTNQGRPGTQAGSTGTNVDDILSMLAGNEGFNVDDFLGIISGWE